MRGDASRVLVGWCVDSDAVSDDSELARTLDARGGRAGPTRFTLGLRGGRGGPTERNGSDAAGAGGAGAGADAVAAEKKGLLLPITPSAPVLYARDLAGEFVGLGVSVSRNGSSVDRAGVLSGSDLRAARSLGGDAGGEGLGVRLRGGREGRLRCFDLAVLELLLAVLSALGGPEMLATRRGGAGGGGAATGSRGSGSTVCQCACESEVVGLGAGRCL